MILHKRLKAWVKQALLSTVQAGPFKGMRYARDSHGSSWLPKVMGTYEMELCQCLIPQLQNPSLCFIDVGAGEGYYAVGALRLNPTCRVIAFEMDESARGTIRRMAALNGVEQRLTILGRCDASLLETAIPPADAFIVMDVEGAEESLLNPNVVPALRHSPILVELHPHAVPDIAETLTRRFSATHRLVTIPARNPSWKDLPREPWRTLGRCFPWLENRLLWERPPGMSWMQLTPMQKHERTP